MQQLKGISLMLLALGSFLWVYMRERRYGKPLTSPMQTPSPILCPRRRGAGRTGTLILRGIGRLRGDSPYGCLYFTNCHTFQRVVLKGGSV